MLLKKLNYKANHQLAHGNLSTLANHTFANDKLRCEISQTLCLKCCSCAAIFVLLQRKVLQQEIVAGIVLASLGHSAKGGGRQGK